MILPKNQFSVNQERILMEKNILLHRQNTREKIISFLNNFLIVAFSIKYCVQRR